MPSRFLNVRLKADDAKLVRLIQASGISVSDVVREALHAKAAELSAAGRRSTSIKRLIESIIERYPTSEEAAPIVDTTNRKAASAFIRGKLVAKHREISRDPARHERAGRRRRSA